MKLLTKYKYHLAILLIAIIAFWQIVFFIYPVKYDMLDCFYPWRYFIGECLQQGKLPLWNPYQDLGYPIHADPSSGAWYPIVWIIGYTSGYNLYSIGIELLFHIFIAGIGFYTLSKTLKLSDNTAFVAGVSYMLCGIFIGNAQHLFDIISACWLPHILNYYLKITTENGYLNSIKAAFFLFLLITGGYPAFTIILFYLLLVLFVYHLAKMILNKHYQTAIAFIKRNAIFLIATILLSCVMLTSIYEVMPYLTRTAAGLTLKSALFGPFSPQSSISFILPFASITDPTFFDTDLSMTNAYFGLILFLFFIYGLFIKKPALYNILLCFALFSLLAAFGKYLPVREFLFNHVPMMNTFRFPSVFRYYVIIGFLLVAAFSFEKFTAEGAEKHKKTMIHLALLFMIAFLVFIIASRLHGYLNLGNFIKHELFIFSKTSTIAQHIAFQSILQIGVLLSFIFILWKIEERNKRLKLITLLIVTDMIVCTQLNAPYTAFYKEFSAKKSQQHINKFPKGFPLLANKNISEIKPDSLYFGPFWKNLNIFQKQVSADGYNSFCLTNFGVLRDSTPPLFSEITKNKIAFLSDNVLEEKQMKQFKKDSAFTNKTLFFNKEVFTQLKNLDLRSEIGDTAQLIYFAPDSFIVKTETQHSQLLTLLQNNYTGWEVYVNSKKAKIYTSNKTLISTVVPAGKNTVSFIYKNHKIKIAFYISLVSIFTCLFIIILSPIITIQKASKD